MKYKKALSLLMVLSMTVSMLPGQAITDASADTIENDLSKDSIISKLSSVTKLLHKSAPESSGLAGVVYDDLIEITDQEELDTLEGQGWLLREDGTLILKDNDGVVNWCCARAAISMNRSGSYYYGTDGDPALAAKVTNILFGYQFQKWDEDILDYVMVPRIVDTISSGAFENCVNLKKVVLTRYVHSVDRNSFKGCTSLEELITESGAYLGEAALYGCTSLKRVSYADMPKASETHFADKSLKWDFSDDYVDDYLMHPYEYDTFDQTNIDLVINVPKQYEDDVKKRYTKYVPLVNASSTDHRYCITVNGEYFTDEHKVIKCGDGTAEFDPSTKTLTLQNASITKSLTPFTTYDGFVNELTAPFVEDSFRDDSIIYSGQKDLTILFKGENKLATYVPDGEIDYYYKENHQAGDSFAVLSTGNVIFKGDGSFETYLMKKNTNKEYYLSDKRIGSKIAVDGNITFDGVSIYRLLNYSSTVETSDDTGTITIKDSTLSEVDLTAPSGLTVKNSSVTVNNTSINKFGAIYEQSRIEVWSGDISIENSEFVYADVSNYCPYVGVEKEPSSLTANGITLKSSKIYAKAKVNVTNINCDYANEKDLEDKSEKIRETFENRIYGTDITVTGKGTAKYLDLMNYENDNKKGISITDVDLYNGKIRSDGDLVMNKASLAGMKIDVTGNLKMTDCKANAFYENQNSTITVLEGEKVDIINCDFQAIAETQKGERQVYLGNGLPMVETFYYNTMSGVSLFLGDSSDLDRETTLNFKDSRIMMAKIGLTGNVKVNIDETRMLLCDSRFSYYDYDYDSNVKLKGNIAIVTGAWNMDNTTGIFIDYLGDYYTFDEKSGTLYLNNHYGVRGWFQKSRYWDNKYGKYRPKTEITDKVKKIVIGDDVTGELSETFESYVNLKEIDFGNGVTSTYGQVLSGCYSVEKITYGKNIEYFNDDDFTDCPKLKTFVISSDNLNVENANNMTFRRNHANLNIVVPKELEKKYKTVYFPNLSECVNRSEDNINYPLTVNGEIFTSKKLKIKCGNGTAEFDPASNILTLDNAAITKYTMVSPSNDRKIIGDGMIESKLDKLTIILKGNNVMKWADSNTGLNGNGINAWGALTIKGSGNLEIEREEKVYSENYKEAKYPIIYSTGDMVINDADIKVIYPENYEEPIWGKSYAEKININSNVHYSDYSHGEIKFTEKPITIINSTLEGVTLDPSIDKNLLISNSTINGKKYGEGVIITIPDEPYSNIIGDLDNDGKVTSADSLLILRQSVGLERFTDIQIKLADVDGDGKITSADSLEVLRASVGLSTIGNIGEKYDISN